MYFSFISIYSISEFEQAIKDLNNGRARDPEGWYAEIFQINVMGEDLKISMLELMNEIKKNGQVPDFMKVFGSPKYLLRKL